MVKVYHFTYFYMPLLVLFLIIIYITPQNATAMALKLLYIVKYFWTSKKTK